MYRLPARLLVARKGDIQLLKSIGADQRRFRLCKMRLIPMLPLGDGVSFSDLPQPRVAPRPLRGVSRGPPIRPIARLPWVLGRQAETYPHVVSVFPVKGPLQRLRGERLDGTFDEVEKIAAHRNSPATAAMNAMMPPPMSDRRSPSNSDCASPSNAIWPFFAFSTIRLCLSELLNPTREGRDGWERGAMIVSAGGGGTSYPCAATCGRNEAYAQRPFSPAKALQ